MPSAIAVIPAKAGIHAVIELAMPVPGLPLARERRSVFDKLLAFFTEKAFEDLVGIEIEGGPRVESGEFLVALYGAEVTPVVEHMHDGFIAVAFAHADAAAERPGL